MGSGRGGSRKEGEWKRGDNFDYCCFPLPIEVIKPNTSYEFSQKQKIRKTEAKVRSIAVFASIPTPVFPLLPVSGRSIPCQNLCLSQTLASTVFPTLYISLLAAIKFSECLNNKLYTILINKEFLS